MTLDLANTPSPADLWEMDRAHSACIPGPISGRSRRRARWSSRGAMGLSLGCRGAEVFDAVGGLWCTNIGPGAARDGACDCRSGASAGVFQHVRGHDQWSDGAAGGEDCRTGAGRSEPGASSPRAVRRRWIRRCGWSATISMRAGSRTRPTLWRGTIPITARPICRSRWASGRATGSRSSATRRKGFTICPAPIPIAVRRG
jgi:hypothetical protein